MNRRGRKERRRQGYDFPTVGALYQYFGEMMPRETLITAVREAIADFVPREGIAADETRLQLVRKCEHRLRNISASGQPAGLPG